MCAAMGKAAAQPKILVLGIGNTLRRDDGIGVRVVEALRDDARCGDARSEIAFRDGGTLGLSLLPEIEEAGAVIVIDAGEIGAEPGAVRSFEGPDMDMQLTGKKHTAHEVALDDLMSAAGLVGRRPARRALIAIQPASTDWGLEPTSCVSAAIPLACAAVLALIEKWT